MGLKNLIKKYIKLDYKIKSGIGGIITLSSNFILAFLKAILGIFTSSIFLFISALYSTGCGMGRLTYFIGTKNSQTENDELKYYLYISLILFSTSVIYIIYMIRLFFIPSSAHYPMIAGISLATISTWEMFWSIRGLVKSHKRNDLLLSGLKAIGLATALLSIVLTQIAILSFTMPNEDCSVYNALAGTVFGGMCVCISISMLARYKRHMNRIKKNEQTE